MIAELSIQRTKLHDYRSRQLAARNMLFKDYQPGVSLPQTATNPA
jgi:hypothetical protein